MNINLWCEHCSRNKYNEIVNCETCTIEVETIIRFDKERKGY